MKNGFTLWSVIVSLLVASFTHLAHSAELFAPTCLQVLAPPALGEIAHVRWISTTVETAAEPTIATATDTAPGPSLIWRSLFHVEALQPHRSQARGLQRVWHPSDDAVILELTLQDAERHEPDTTAAIQIRQDYSFVLDTPVPQTPGAVVSRDLYFVSRRTEGGPQYQHYRLTLTQSGGPHGLLDNPFALVHDSSRRFFLHGSSQIEQDHSRRGR